ncbi:hypothetical protein [Sporosarcina sp. FSL W7-1283]|uniref:hypothetical protein n=1 Tax=Sporosarcina sp. FSL W7-1283 TaxID=2921560 RepID=UPI0030FC300F
MYEFQKKIYRLEQPVNTFYYPYQLEIISDNMIMSVALYNKKGGPILTTKDKIDKLLDINKMPFNGKRSFDKTFENEPEEVLKEFVIEGAIRSMAHYGVRGIKHTHIEKDIPWISLERGKDFNIIVGARVEIEQENKPTFDDIEVL